MTTPPPTKGGSPPPNADGLEKAPSGEPAAELEGPPVKRRFTLPRPRRAIGQGAQPVAPSTQSNPVSSVDATKPNHAPAGKAAESDAPPQNDAETGGGKAVKAAEPNESGEAAETDGPGDVAESSTAETAEQVDDSTPTPDASTGAAPESAPSPAPTTPRPRLAPSAPRSTASRVLLDPPIDASAIPPTPPRRKPRVSFKLPRFRAPRSAFIVTAAAAALLGAMTRLGEPLRSAFGPANPPQLSALRPASSGEALAGGPPSAEAPRDDAPPQGGPWRLEELAHDPNVRVVRGKLGQNSLVDALEEAKVQRAQIYRILHAFSDAKRFDRPRKNDAFAVAVERAGGRVRAFEYQASASDVWQAREDEGGKLVGTKLDLHVEQRRVARAVLVRDDLKSSVVEAGFDDDLLDALDDALDDRVALTSLHRGAALRIVAQEQTVLGKFARYVDVEAVEYTPPSNNAAPVRVYHYKGGKAAGYYDGRGRAPYQGGWRYPIRFPRITSRFNPKRMHPVLHRLMPHNGCDFGAPTGTPIYAAAHGTVEFVGPRGPSGNLVVVDHGSGTQTGYAHLSRFAPGIKPGDKVETRQLVGFAGSTGRSTAPHLHFSLKKNGVFVDPLTLKMDGERVLPPSEREAFDALRQKLDSVLDSIALPERPHQAEPEPEASDEPADEEAPADAEPSAAATPPAQPAQPAQPTPTPPPAPSPAAAPAEGDPSVDSAVWRPK